MRSQDALTTHVLCPLDLIRSINDPEHPLTLEELNVIQQGATVAPLRTTKCLFPASASLLRSSLPIPCLCFAPSRSSTNSQHQHPNPEGLIEVDDKANSVRVRFTPTIPHCSMATLIGLCVRVRLLRALPARFKVDVQITPGMHASEEAGELFPGFGTARGHITYLSARVL